MKKGRYVIWALCIINILFCACTAAKTFETDYFATLSYRYIPYKNGMFHKNGSVMEYLDFDSMISVPICPKPNCTHDSSSCSAWGIGDCVFINGKKLCWFDTKTVMANDRPSTSSDLICADSDGTNRMSIAELDEVVPSGGAYIKNDMLYFCAVKRGYDELTLSSNGYDQMFLYRYDMAAKEFTEVFSAEEGYGSDVMLLGCFENALILRYSNGTEVKRSISDFKYLCYDLSTFDICELEDKVIRAQKDYLITENENGKIIVKPAGEDEIVITNEAVINAGWKDSYRIFDNYLFSESDGFAYDLSSNEIMKINTPGIIVTKYKEKYIVRNSATNTFVNMSKDEIFVK